MLRKGFEVRAACREGVNRQGNETEADVGGLLLSVVVDEEGEEKDEEDGGKVDPRLPARPRVGMGLGSSALLASAKARLLVIVSGVTRGAAVCARDEGAWEETLLFGAWPKGGIL